MFKKFNSQGLKKLLNGKELSWNLDIEDSTCFRKILKNEAKDLYTCYENLYKSKNLSGNNSVMISQIRKQQFEQQASMKPIESQVISPNLDILPINLSELECMRFLFENFQTCLRKSDFFRLYLQSSLDEISKSTSSIQTAQNDVENIMIQIGDHFFCRIGEYRLSSVKKIISSETIRKKDDYIRDYKNQARALKLDPSYTNTIIKFSEHVHSYISSGDFLVFLIDDRLKQFNLVKTNTNKRKFSSISKDIPKKQGILM